MHRVAVSQNTCSPLIGCVLMTSSTVRQLETFPQALFPDTSTAIRTASFFSRGSGRIHANKNASMTLALIGTTGVLAKLT